MTGTQRPPAINNPVRLGIVGCGNVLDAYAAHAERLRASSLAEFVIACGRQAQRERALALGVPRFVTDESEVLGADDIDVVLILTSMPEHGRLARAALEAGKHVLVEKPMATQLDEARDLVAVARRRQRHLVCAPFTMLSATLQTMRRHIADGDIGRPSLARARYGWAGPDWSEWFYKEGGGCLFDLGVYSLTSLTSLLGPAKRVAAMTATHIPERHVAGEDVAVEIEDAVQVTLELESGALGVVTSGFTMQQYRTPAVEVYGSAGTIQMLGDDWDPQGYELWQNSLGAWQVFNETQPNWRWTDGLRHLVECLVKGTVPVVTPEQALHVLEIMIGARRSAREGCVVEIESRFAAPETTRAAAVATSLDSTGAHRQHDRTRESS